MMVSYTLNRRRESLAETGHRPYLYRRQKGLTPTSPARPYYGTHLDCQCGWKTHSNEAPSSGGVQDVLVAWERHAIEAEHPEMAS